LSLLKKKSSVIARSLVEALAVRLPALGVQAGVDASGWPTIQIFEGTLPMATTEQSFFIRIMEMASLGLDSLGNAQQSYGPHVIQLCMETSTVAALGFPTDANRLHVMGECLAQGARLEVYLEDNGTAPDVNSIEAARLVGTFESLRFPPMANV